MTVPGYHLSLDEFDKVTNHFRGISFCGQYSDPSHHPQFIDFLKMCRRKKVFAEVHVASTARSEEFFIEAFRANPEATWIFGIDGLPEQSHHYRVNQDGVKLYNIMLKAREYLRDKPRWQFILFKYNQDNVEKAMEMAKTEGLLFEFIQSARWHRKLEVDPLKPTVVR